MKTFLYFSFVAAVVAHTASEIPEWHPPTGPNEPRSPCPGLNVLANHGILPRDGKNMDHKMIYDALHTWYNIRDEVIDPLFNKALKLTFRPNATSFDMTDIRFHTTEDIAIEMDASFSRADTYWGDSSSFNETVWNQTRSYWQGDTIDVNEFGAAARARYLTSKATNPTFYNRDVTLIGGAMAFMTSVLGDGVAGQVPTRFVDEWIVEERLPTGWSTRERPTDGAGLFDLTGRIFAASGLEANEKTARRDFQHVGFHS